MKAIKSTLLLSFILLLAFNGNAQDDFYKSNVKKQKTKTQKTVAEKLPAIEEYSTAIDYEKANGNYELFTEEAREIDEEEIYQNEKPKKRKNRNSVAGEVVAEIVMEVFINTAFIIAACWR